MRIGINQVLIYDRSTGARRRELILLPAVLRHIAAEGGESVVYVSRDLQEPLLRQLIGTGHNARIVRTPLSAIPTVQRIGRGIPYWRRQARLDRLDLFHTAYYPVPRLPMPTVLTVHDTRHVHMPDTYPRLRRLFLQMFVPSSLKRATRVIAVSQNTKEDLVNMFGLKRAKIDIIYNPADPHFCRVYDTSVLKQVSKRYQLPERFILCVGHLEPRKNLDRLLQAFARLRAENAIVHSLVILGKASYGFEPLLDQVRSCGLASQVVFTGYVREEDMAAVYSLAEVLAFPSLHEGFGIPLLEAMACGVPVLTSNVSALPEVAGNTAVLVEPTSVASIAEGIDRVLHDEELRKYLVAQGTNRIKDFDVEKAAVDTVETYRKTLGLGPS